MIQLQELTVDRIGKEGGMYLSWYGQQTCTAGRAAFITGQSLIRTGLTKVGHATIPRLVFNSISIC